MKAIADMERTDVLAELKRYFNVGELVCQHVLERDGEKAWAYLQTDALKVLLALRTQVLRVPLVCNTDTMHQRGLRCNLCELVANNTKKGSLYMSAHSRGCAFDLTAPNMTAEEMRKRVEDYAILLPVPVRIEDGVNWLHIDTVSDGDGKKVKRFKA